MIAHMVDNGIFRTRVRLKKPKFRVIGDRLTAEAVAQITVPTIVEMTERVKQWSDNNETIAFAYAVVRRNGYVHFAHYATAGQKHLLVANILYLLNDMTGEE